MSPSPYTRTLPIVAAVLLLTAPRAAAEGGSADEAAPPDRWADARDPFWPIGYTPPPPPEAEPADAPPAAIQVELQWPELRLTSLARTGGGQHLAIIEGVGIVESGETIQIERDGIIYRWRVDAVTTRGINVRRLDARPARGGLHNVGQ